MLYARRAGQPLIGAVPAASILSLAAGLPHFSRLNACEYICTSNGLFYHAIADTIDGHMTSSRYSLSDYMPTQLPDASRGFYDKTHIFTAALERAYLFQYRRRTPLTTRALLK